MDTTSSCPLLYTRHLRDRSSVNFVRDSRTGFAVLLEKYPGFILLVQYFSKFFLAFADPVDVLSARWRFDHCYIFGDFRF